MLHWHAPLLHWICVVFAWHVLCVLILVSGCDTHTNTLHQSNPPAQSQIVTRITSDITDRDIFARVSDNNVVPPAPLIGWRLVGTYGDALAMHTAVIYTPDKQLLRLHMYDTIPKNYVPTYWKKQQITLTSINTKSITLTIDTQPFILHFK